jgi:hypothetical protein
MVTAGSAVRSMAKEQEKTLHDLSQVTIDVMEK